jgi:hypothetical protein
MARFTGAGVVVFAADETKPGCNSFRAFAHLALCARAIFNREAFEMNRFGAATVPVGWFAFCGIPVPFSDSITEIALSNFSTCDCASRRSARSC